MKNKLLIEDLRTRNLEKKPEGRLCIDRVDDPRSWRGLPGGKFVEHLSKFTLKVSLKKGFF